jgi:hypothetical protein
MLKKYQHGREKEIQKSVPAGDGIVVVSSFYR